MKKALFLVSATTALLLANFMTNSYAYDNVTVFGDSLSDGGNTILGKFTFTTNDEDPELYDDYITRELVHKKLKPSQNGGTNYAYAGATANDSDNLFIHSTQRQLDDYLQAHSGRADPNSVYIHWVGGNDVKDAIVKYFDQGDKDGAQQNINDSSASAASQINQLAKAGAGLIIAPNVPDIGTTPKIMEKVLKGALGKSQISEEEIKKILQQVHEAINKYPTPNKEIRDKVLQGVFEKIAEGASPEDPDKAKEIYRQLLDAYNNASKTASQFSDQYNQQVENLLGNGNILRADVNKLLHEIIENPTIYGISNTLGYACPYDIWASSCDSSDPGFDKSQPYLFSDSFHPTPDAHKVIGQYIMSIYTAPLQVRVLNSVNRIPVTTTLSLLDSHLQQLRNNGNAQGKVGVFGGYTGNNNSTLTLGGDYQLADNWLLGTTLSRYKTEQDVTSHFNYAATGHIITAYTLWNYYDNGWLSGDVHYSRTHYDNLSRSIQLGAATRRESGSTMGRQWGWRITAGWDIPITRYLTTSPIIQYAWDNGSIDGYRETGNNSTTMHFGDQNYHSRVGSVGWRVDTKLGYLNPYASILFNHQFDDERYTLRSAINSTKTSFVLPGEKQDRNRIQYTVGVNANLTDNFHAFAAVSHEKNDNGPNHNYNFNLGFNVSF
ncbi:autotransporter domain-containing protein [Xenorhabdus sp. PR6a]|uniref:autotransporter outer membrane beta-barrel domain-containing protein n=1 Tax=Xenorhabdus sp. PR6a TaxID=3025877 RepID=UPI0023587D79|nr:autotransporter domain-containing protein [Xenorhabdus sp. PR6a]MDC9580545.1 autotransporter domain-containing protein [Xenorhabdus sp. PR6a]